jgi:hypothetical protein
VGPLLRQRQPFARHGLCRLTYAEDFRGAARDPRPDFTPWTDGLGACILEVWQNHLAEHWLRVERGKAAVTNWQEMRALGQAQDQVLHRFCTAVESAGRLDLARFLLRVASQLLTADATPQAWTGGLTGAGPRMAERTETYRAALAVLRQLEHLRQWQQRARAVGYFDEGYAASQLWKADWDSYDGDTLYTRSQSIIRQLEPLAV